jgi:hypothetical protein
MFPRWLSWTILAALGYVIYSASQQAAPVRPAALVAIPAITQESYPALAQATDIEQWKRRLNPDYAAKNNCSLDAVADKTTLTMKVTEDAVGEGDAARCGETITVDITIWNAQGAIAFNGTLPLALGSRQLAAGLDAGLVGIKTGGVRSFLLPPSALVRTVKNIHPNAAAVKALPSNKTAIVTVKRAE